MWIAALTLVLLLFAALVAVWLTWPVLQASREARRVNYEFQLAQLRRQHLATAALQQMLFEARQAAGRDV